MKVMLEEIERKKVEAEQARLEQRRRAKEPTAYGAPSMPGSGAPPRTAEE